MDPYKTSYGVSDSLYALTQLAQTTMRSELGKITLDKCFEERDSLNHAIVASINAAALAWGAEVLRYEIKDISPPQSVKAAMDMQAEAERRKRAEILESEGRRQSAINTAEGQRQSAILSAQGEAEAVLAKAGAAAAAVDLLAGAISRRGGREAVSLRVAEQYVEQFGKLAKSSTTMLLPADAANPATMVAQAMAMWGAISAGRGGAGAAAAAAAAEDAQGGADDLLRSVGAAGAPPAAPLAGPFVPRDFSS